jgi:hypothetical protein
VACAFVLPRTLLLPPAALLLLLLLLLLPAPWSLPLLLALLLVRSAVEVPSMTPTPFSRCSCRAAVVARLLRRPGFPAVLMSLEEEEAWHSTNSCRLDTPAGHTQQGRSSACITPAWLGHSCADATNMTAISIRGFSGQDQQQNPQA